jgi:hypothetical protein
MDNPQQQKPLVHGCRLTCVRLVGYRRTSTTKVPACVQSTRYSCGAQMVREDKPVFTAMIRPHVSGAAMRLVCSMLQQQAEERSQATCDQPQKATVDPWSSFALRGRRLSAQRHFYADKCAITAALTPLWRSVVRAGPTGTVTHCLLRGAETYQRGSQARLALDLGMARTSSAGGASAFATVLGWGSCTARSERK